MHNKENYTKAYERDNYVCQVCGSPATQIGHRIGQGKLCRSMYGSDIIDHVVNLVSVCDLKCNKKVDVTSSPIEREKVLVEIINYELEHKGV